MTWTTPVTKSDGDLIDQTIWNAQLVNNLLHLLATVEPASMTNNSGGSLGDGSVVILDASADNSFTTTTSADSAGVIGVVRETIANAATGRVALQGVVTVLVQGNVTRGNYLSTSTTAARAKDAGASPAVGTFARALTGYAGGGAGSVTALLLPSTVGAVGVPANVVAFTTDSSAPSGWAEYTTARGRFIVGVPSAGTVEGTSGATALTNLAGALANHSHSVAQSDWTSDGPNATTEVQSGTGTTVAASSHSHTLPYQPSNTANNNVAVPYVQLFTIKKS